MLKKTLEKVFFIEICTRHRTSSKNVALIVVPKLETQCQLWATRSKFSNLLHPRKVKKTFYNYILTADLFSESLPKSCKIAFI